MRGKKKNLNLSINSRKIIRKDKQEKRKQQDTEIYGLDTLY